LSSLSSPPASAAPVSAPSSVAVVSALVWFVVVVASAGAFGASVGFVASGAVEACAGCALLLLSLA